MHFLNARRFAGGDTEKVIGEWGQFGSSLAGKDNRHEALRARRGESGKHVGAVARGGNSHQHIAGVAERFHLAGKDRFEAKVVGSGGQNGCIGGERDGGHAAAVSSETDNDFSGKVLRIRRAAAVAAPENLPAGVEAGGHDSRNRREHGQLRFGGAHHIQMLVNGLPEDGSGIGTGGHASPSFSLAFGRCRQKRSNQLL